MLKLGICTLSLILFGFGVHHFFSHVAESFAVWLAVREINPPAAPQLDAIIVLGGNTSARMEKGVELYNNGVAPRLALTGYSPDGPSAELDELLTVRDVALAAGVRERDFTMLNTSSTWEDAEQIARYVHQHDLRRFVVVSDWTHGRRAVCTILHELGSNPPSVYFVPASPEQSPGTWWLNDKDATEVLNEVAKMGLYALLYNVPFWNCLPGEFDLANYMLLIGLGFITSIASVGWIRRNAARLGRIDVPNERSSHALPTPRGGGLGIVFTVVGLWVVTNWLWPRQIVIPLWMALGFPTAAVLIAMVGWFDDKRSVSPRLRLLLYSLVCSGFVATVGTFNRVELPVLGVIPLNGVIAFGLTLLWLVGFLNIFNFMDGIDGLAGGQAFSAAVFWSILFCIGSQAGLAFLACLLAVSCLGFLLHNLPPARIFMGDVGSAFLGFALAALPLMSYMQTNNPRTPVACLFFVAPFVFDGTLTILRRLLRRENIFEPHRSHLYQQLVIAGQSHRQVTLQYYLLMLLCGGFGLMYYVGEQAEMLVSIGLTLSMLVVFSIYVSVVTSRTRQGIRLTS